MHCLLGCESGFERKGGNGGIWFEGGNGGICLDLKADLKERVCHLTKEVPKSPDLKERVSSQLVVVAAKGRFGVYG